MDRERDAWRDVLRDARRSLGLSQHDLAEQVGLSFETIRAYEGGRRRPSREHLERLILTVKIPAVEANELRAALGYAQAASVFMHGKERNYYSVEELPEVLSRFPWPAFVNNDAVEVVAANVSAEAVWQIDFAEERRRRSRVQMNLLSVASDHHFADRILNWDEVLATMVAVYKANMPNPYDLTDGNPWFAELLGEFARGDPAFLPRLIEIWNRTPPGTYKYRWEYRVEWEAPGIGVMRFLGICSMANEPDALFFNDWIPVDAESWRVLEAVKARGDRP